MPTTFQKIWMPAFFHIKYFKAKFKFIGLSSMLHSWNWEKKGDWNSVVNVVHLDRIFCNGVKSTAKDKNCTVIF